MMVEKRRRVLLLAYAEASLPPEISAAQQIIVKNAVYLFRPWGEKQ